ncbi:CCAAT/enhancer-binding protein gamma [Bagarius yarrelli]|uniref:CCAAT/enhancer-binding protein gamma n=1 Tax=Bagarius yarrelli TaxID=175774 RepID=A0A556V3G9_BAGYA|nr:CCAAT/enhancer-binding protein gamma [Bagarius yarrelli]
MMQLKSNAGRVGSAQHRAVATSRNRPTDGIQHPPVAGEGADVSVRERQRIQMSKQPQQKLTNADQNGVSVIQSQAQSSAAGATAGLQQVPQLVPVSPEGGGKATPPSKMKKSLLDKNSDEYRQRRERNNLAVKKSRMRSKQKAQDTQQRVNELKEENERLEAKIKLLSKELSVLKDLFLEHAHNLADNVQPANVAPGDLCNNNNNSQ